MSRKIKTFDNQNSLPKLPVPKLEESTSRYLRTLLPLLSAQDVARNEAYVKDFLKPDGLGNVLQQRLFDVDRSSPHNWLDDTFWTQKAYQEWRVPLIVNSNWYLLFIDDKNTPKEYLSRDNHDGARPRGEFSEFQVKRAAHLIWKLLEFKELLDSENLPPETTRLYPLCMHQYRRCYGVTRIPQHGCDSFPYAPHPFPVKTVLIIAKDQFYLIEAYDQNGQILSEGDIGKQLNDIIKDLNNKDTKFDPPIGVLTADDRDKWTIAREHLLTLSPQNRETLNKIEDSLFAISLDDYATGLDLDLWARNVLHGFNGHNRWYDKAISIIIESNGRAAMNGEHSPCDALIPSNIGDYILKDSTLLSATLSGRPIPPPERIRFVTNEQTLHFIREAEERIKLIVEDSDAVILHYYEYGADFIKKTGKCSPDAYLQMVLQLAYYKLHKKVCATYETASTRKFKHGRTETIRTLSVESKAFVEGMVNNNLSAHEKYKLLQTATKVHSAYTRDASEGRGCDRHLLGLRLLLKQGESHHLFSDPAFAKSQEWLLSTSGLSAGDRFNGSGFGCVYPDGYGINYQPGSYVLKFGIESKKSSTQTDSNLFRESVKNALNDIKAICEKVNGKYVKQEKL
ncbi:1596_t:CDS:2 [Ambispora leptoticha]|uniref:1596_t:CDS:1 n=1 Tax=Ambispora leptoticha TaxID=144679 RepID=A0A9N9BGT3_9GLOM|nr:1596_t:CDS:2 [Ambispora leptoticha]